MFTKKWLLRLGLGFLGLIVLGMVAVYAEWTITRNRGQELLDKEIAKVDAEDPDWRVEDLCSKRNAALPPPEKNSSPCVMQAYELIPKDYFKWKRDELKASTDTVGVLADEDELRIATERYKDAYQAILVARTSRQFPHGGFPLTFKEPDLLSTPLKSLDSTRQIASLLDHDAFILVHRGETDEAVRTLHAMVHVSRAVGDEPSAISQLVRIASIVIACRATQRTLGLCEPKVGLGALQVAFAEELNVPRLTYGFRGERAVFHRILENIDDGSYDANAPTKGGLESRIEILPLRRTIPKQQAVMLDYFGQLLAAEKLTGVKRISAFAAIQPPATDGKYDMSLVRLLLIATDKVVGAENRARAVIGSTIVALACERFHHTNGRFPTSIAEIPTSLLPNVPDDPFNAKPLNFKTLDDGIVIYSVGADLVDDGGTNLDLTAKVGGDVGFKLLLPEKRRQPAPPRMKPIDDEPENPGVP